ncbi:hypothetical protein Sjap_026421 [Stephania japonica]|uniref:Uncharacterized protein n=1 Tax=Stephania japonica TaxID=461633 RepID=A0AAP0HKF6_9MAGN
MGRSWRQYKSRLTVALMKTKKKNYKGKSYKQLRPSNLFTEAEWETYVKKRTSPEVETWMTAQTFMDPATRPWRAQNTPPSKDLQELAIHVIWL